MVSYVQAISSESRHEGTYTYTSNCIAEYSFVIKVLIILGITELKFVKVVSEN
jgi:hypothetical protein